MGSKDPAVRGAAASIAALARWSKQDTTEGTKPARKGFMARFEREVDPDNELTPRERAIRAERAMRAHMKRLSLSSARKRAVAA